MPEARSKLWTMIRHNISAKDMFEDGLGNLLATVLFKVCRSISKYCYIKVDRWLHFVDSQTILGAIQKDSYGFQTFFANWTGEIQKAVLPLPFYR